MDGELHSSMLRVIEHLRARERTEAATRDELTREYRRLHPNSPETQKLRNAALDQQHLTGRIGTAITVLQAEAAKLFETFPENS